MVRLQWSIQQTNSFVLGALLFSASVAAAQKFVADDPLRKVPEVESAQHAGVQAINPLYDFIVHSVQYKTPPPTPSKAVNSLGEVPDLELVYQPKTDIEDDPSLS